MTRPGGPILPPVPPAPDETRPPLRHTSLVLVERRTQMSTALGVSGRGSLRFGTDESALDLVVEDFDAARRLHEHEQTGELLTRLRGQILDEHRAHLRADLTVVHGG